MLESVVTRGAASRYFADDRICLAPLEPSVRRLQQSIGASYVYADMCAARCLRGSLEAASTQLARVRQQQQ